MHKFYSGKSIQNIGDTSSVIFIKLPKVNNRPEGENPSNQVTLVAFRTRGAAVAQR
jgi:hypothetical protein